MRFSRVMGLVVGLWVCLFAISMTLWLRAFVLAELNYQFGQASLGFISTVALMIGMIFGVYGAWRDETRVSEFLLGSAIHIVCVSLILFGVGSVVSLKPPPIAFALVVLLVPLLQCVCVGVGYLVFTMWARRDLCPLRRFA